ncbi:mannose-P-dolichol utilization defect 1 protein [Phytophthora infestans T30-4]|uniref:Mannose-P-dolichol utilization defect 1 protein homolog n=2 Tax=Phytophthora infestans (strain T30-4) TaxID=403677 RepID=D0NCC3_PHYIT|nr:mannose-P-dolichol utilization defect 1 protein [Phytophthora infestans T30-4]EEY55637.1 mannose-P-dolichol utilization defect 1 protein [Phytophthora infestans T30-4]|eukprot:XP_002903213.1 mannose-P-dolichol utilization defect 1 protein [Phytophthora infestans T30-4]
MAKMPQVCAALALATAMLASSTMAEKKADDELVLGLFTPRCFEAFVTHHDFGHVECIKAVISKGLSYAIITGSLILKLPQILKILSAKDVTGLTPSAFYMEVVLYLSSTIYNVLRGYPLSTWGENVVILAQNIILVLLLWSFYTPKIAVSPRFGLVLAFAAIAAGMFSIPDEYQWLLASAGIPVSIVARIPQILSNFKQGHTGQLALITLVLNFAGSIARLFTTMQETGDPVQVAGFGVAILLNGTLVLQVLLFWGATNKALAQATKKKDQ